MSSFPLNRTAWMIHYQFAHQTRTPWREERLAYFKKRDDDGMVVGEETQMEDEGNARAGGGVPPWQAAMGFRERIFHLATDTLIGNLTKHAGNEEALKQYLEKNRGEIIATVYEQGGHSLQDAKRVNSVISGQTMRPVDIHQLIEKLIAPKPEKDPNLKDALIVHAPEKGESKEKKLSRWQKLLARIATLTHPLYRRLASFLGNKTVLSIGISPDSIFEDLRDKKKRLHLFRKLASARHDLVLENATSIDDRKAALEDLQAILYHGQFMLEEGEKGEFYELYCRVSAAKLMVEGEGEMYAQEKMQPKEEKQSHALDESEIIRRFLGNERGKEHVIRGEEGLRTRLQKKAHELGEENAFSILAKGLGKDEWLGALHVPENLKYTCILIALEEIAILKRDIALGKTHEPVNLSERIKMTVLTLLQRGTRGFPEERAGAVFITRDTTPAIRQDFEELKNKISREEHPSRADVDEILLLHAWLSRNDDQFDADSGMKREIGIWRKNAEVTSIELQNEAADARKDLAESLLDTSPLRAEVLRDASPEILLSALSEIEEEKAIEAMRVRLERNVDLLPPEKRHKISREPPLLHKVCDEEYAEKRLQRVRELLEKNVSIVALNKDPIIIKLDEEYDKERVLRLTMHSAFVLEQEAKILAVLEADIRAKSAGLQESFSRNVGKRMKKRLKLRNAGVQELAQAVEKMEWDQLPDVLTEDEMETIVALGALKTLSLRTSATPFEAAQLSLDQLDSLEREVKEADEYMNEREETILASKRAAQHIVDDPKTPEELRTIVTPVAKGEVKISGGPGAKMHMLQDYRVQQAILPAFKEHPDAAPGEVATLEKRLRSIEQRMDAILPSYLGKKEDTLGERAKEKIEEEKKSLAADLEAAQKRGESGDILSRAKIRIEALEACVQILEANEKSYEELEAGAFAKYIEREETLRGKKPKFIFGVYNRKEKNIVLNKTALDYYYEEEGIDARGITLLHERRHAFHDALREIFPTFLTSAYDALRVQSPAIEERGKELMPKKGLTEEEWKDEVMDEVLVRAFVQDEKGEEMQNQESSPGMRVSAKDRALFQESGAFIMPLNFEKIVTHRGRRILVAYTGDPDDEEAGGVAVATPPPVATVERSPNFLPPPFKQGSEITTNFEYVRQGFIKLDGFLNANDSINTPKNMATLKKLRGKSEKLREEFRQNSYAEEDKNFIDRVTNLKDKVKTLVTAMNEWDTAQRDLREVPRKPTLWHTISNSIEFMCVNDFIAIGKAIGEDIQRKHHRREQGRIGRVGMSLTDWIGKTWGLKEIPYINTLSAEFLRREKHEEQEEVENWKKALEEVDSYELLDLLHHPSNPDHMKAMLLLLAERGRMDWSDTKFWKALNNFSYYKMPEKECMQNENLREDWLRKLMSDIWDKDFFRQIRTKNDSGISSKKKEFNSEVDRLSNMGGGMKQELAKQLKLFVHAKKHHHHVPDDVQPHLYEELIHYAMRAGKMTMEDKFFYLIQGIAEGLISRDRLAVIAGEGGEGLLNTFPFIDYFYGRNNTIVEIQSLAKRLRETNDWEKDEYYTSGAKTTYWLELEVAREESVQQRLSKGMIKRGQETDHDDMHFFIPRLDVKTIDTLTLPAGGGRPQLSDQAWMNAYTGFNSYFKSFGMVAKLEDENLGKFSSTDTQDIIRALATFVRMDGIMTQRSTFGGSEDRRMALSWDKMRTQKSVVNTNNDTVYVERLRVDAFIKKVIKAYNLDPDYIKIMLYNTEEKGAFNKTYANKADDKVSELSNKFEIELRKAIISDGAGKLKDILVHDEMGFTSHNKQYNYDFVRNEANKQKLSPSDSAPAGAHGSH